MTQLQTVYKEAKEFFEMQFEFLFDIYQILHKLHDIYPEDAVQLFKGITNAVELQQLKNAIDIILQSIAKVV